MKAVSNHSNYSNNHQLKRQEPTSVLLDSNKFGFRQQTADRSRVPKVYQNDSQDYGNTMTVYSTNKRSDNGGGNTQVRIRDNDVVSLQKHVNKNDRTNMTAQGFRKQDFLLDGFKTLDQTKMTIDKRNTSFYK